jgi:SAM-dependent methyltransferase
MARDQVSGRVLDVGGFDGYWVSTLGDVEAHVIDVSVKPSGGGAHFVRGSGTELPYGDGTFDHVFALDVIEHVDDDAALVAEMLRVLRPGGGLTLTTPSDRIRIFPQQFQSWADRRWGHDRVRGYSAEQLRGLFDVRQPSSVNVVPLGTPTFRAAYLPLSVAWRMNERLGQTLARAAVWRDAGRRGDRGYMLIDARK